MVYAHKCCAKLLACGVPRFLPGKLGIGQIPWAQKYGAGWKGLDLKSFQPVAGLTLQREVYSSDSSASNMVP